MAKRQPLQRTFEGGVATPLIYGRSDLPGFHKSAKTMLNMFPDSRGPAVNRLGLEYKFDVGDPADLYGRLFTFRASYTQTFVVIVTPTLVQVTDKSGLVESVTKIINGGFLQDASGWITDSGPAGSVTFPEKRCRLISGFGEDSFAHIEQEVTGLIPGNNHILRVDSHTISVNQQDRVILQVGTAQGLADIIDTTIFTVSNFEIAFVPGVADLWVRVRVESTRSFILVPPIDGEPGDPVFTFESNVRDIDLISLVDLTVDPNPGFVEFPSPWTEAQLHDVQVEMAPDLQRMYFVHREVPAQQLDLDITQDPFSWDFAPAEFDWTPGVDPWEEFYPGAITFFQARLYLAGTIAEPVSVWGSKPGAESYNDFSDAGGADADDPIKVILARNADIQWMQGSKVLYVGCDNSEHIITSDGPAVINADIDTQQQSAYGSARINVDWVSNQIAFTSWDQRRLRLINYVSNSRNIDSSDLTFPSEHLTFALITEMHHAAHPVNRIWCPMADGTALSCTFEKDRAVSAWAPHNTVGLIKSITVAEEQGHSVVYMLINRKNGLRLVRLGRKELFMDEYAERGYPDPTNIVDRLEHLEGDTVQVVGDGNLYPNAVVSGGEITTDGPAASNYVVGLPLPRLLETLLIDDIRGGESSVASKKSWNRIFVRVFESIIPIINGKRPPDRTALTPMDEREPNRSVDHIVHNVGWDYEGTITIAQDLPFNLIVTGIYGELSEEKL